MSGKKRFENSCYHRDLSNKVVVFRFNKWMTEGFKAKFEDKILVYLKNIVFFNKKVNKCIDQCIGADLREIIIPKIRVLEHSKMVSINSIIRRAGIKPLISSYRYIKHVRRFERYVVVYGRSFVGMYRVGRTCSTLGCMPVIVASYHVFIGEMFFSEEDKRKVLGFMKYLAHSNNSEYIAVYKPYNPDFIYWMGVEPVHEHSYHRFYSVKDFPDIEVEEKPIERMLERW